MIRHCPGNSDIWCVVQHGVHYPCATEAAARFNDRLDIEREIADGRLVLIPFDENEKPEVCRNEEVMRSVLVSDSVEQCGLGVLVPWPPCKLLCGVAA